MKFFEIDDNNNLAIKYLGEFDSFEKMEEEFDDFNENNVFSLDELIDLKKQMLESLNFNFKDDDKDFIFYGFTYESKEFNELGYFSSNEEFYKMYRDDHWCLDFSLTGNIKEMKTLISDIDKTIEEHNVSKEVVIDYFEFN